MAVALRVLITFLLVGFISVPVSILATLLLFPFWSWLEAWTGIESVGHSGPAQWCYVAVFLVVAASALLIAFVRRRAKTDRANAA